MSRIAAVPGILTNGVSPGDTASGWGMLSEAWKGIGLAKG